VAGRRAILFHRHTKDGVFSKTVKTGKPSPFCSFDLFASGLTFSPDGKTIVPILWGWPEVLLAGLPLSSSGVSGQIAPTCR
jgi:hypothetical protein